MKESKAKRGGKRPNSGRKQRYGEPLKAITVRVPESKAHEIKDLIKNKLKEYVKKV